MPSRILFFCFVSLFVLSLAACQTTSNTGSSGSTTTSVILDVPTCS